MIKLLYKEAECFSEDKPAIFDNTSSKVGIYIRRNIRQDKNEDGIIVWKYQEAYLTNEEYEQYISEKESVSLTTIMQTLSDIQLQLDILSSESDMEET